MSEIAIKVVEREISDSRSLFASAVIGSELVGSCRLAELEFSSQFLHELWVREDQRGRGIAGQLVVALTAEARKRRLRELTTYVLRENSSSLRVFEKLGWCVDPTPACTRCPAEESHKNIYLRHDIASRSGRRPTRDQRKISLTVVQRLIDGETDLFCCALAGSRVIGSAMLVDIETRRPEIMEMWVDGENAALAARMVCALVSEAERRGWAEVRSTLYSANAFVESVFRDLGWRECAIGGGTRFEVAIGGAA